MNKKRGRERKQKAKDLKGCFWSRVAFRASHASGRLRAPWILNYLLPTVQISAEHHQLVMTPFPVTSPGNYPPSCDPERGYRMSDFLFQFWKNFPTCLFPSAPPYLCGPMSPHSSFGRCPVQKREGSEINLANFPCAMRPKLLLWLVSRRHFSN